MNFHLIVGVEDDDFDEVRGAGAVAGAEGAAGVSAVGAEGVTREDTGTVAAVDEALAIFSAATDDDEDVRFSFFCVVAPNKLAA